jgi:PAS domain S-box-containing protein
VTTILIVDDNEQNLYQLQVLLGGNGYQVVSAANGAEALAMARQNPPELAISDILMPVMDGFALCREWRKDERLKAIPLVFYTATYTDDRDRELALGHGADRFIVKPEESDVLLQIVREVLAERQQTGGAGQRESVGDEPVFLREYNQALVRKLEAKLEQLERARHELEREIAERKRTEQDLRFRTLVLDTQQEASLDGILVVGDRGQVLSFNRRFLDMWGVPSDLLESRSDTDVLQSVLHKLVAPDDFRSRVEWLYAHPQETSHDEIALIDGRVLDRYSAPMGGPDGQYYGRVWHFRDVTERKRAEEALRRLNRALSTVRECTLAIVRAPDEATILAELCRMLVAHGGYRFAWVGLAEQDEAQSVRPVAQAGFEDGYLETLQVTWADTERGRGPTGTAIRTGQPCSARAILTDPAYGPWRAEAVKRGYASSLVLPLKAEGVVFGALCIYSAIPDAFDSEGTRLLTELANDLAYGITALRTRVAREQAEEALRESRRRLTSIYDTVGDTIFLVAIEADGGFRFESINKRFAETTGVPAEAVVGRRVEEVIPAGSLPLALERYRQAVRQNIVVRWEETSDYPLGRLTGEVSVAPVLDEHGRCTHLVGAVHDVTARKHAEEMLRQSQKLEGIGRLAGGVAHDFNNILGVILGYGELMRRQVGDGHPARPRLEQVIGAAHRAADLTRQILAFSRKQVMQPRLLDLGAVVGNMRSMFERVVGEDLEIVVLSAESLGAVRADPTQIEQVIMNLVVNARDAMPNGGRLTIETRDVDLDGTYAAAHPPALPGHFVMLAVSDTGIGMDAETQRQIFEPFFTTKPPGEGTGLGLATVYGIVKQMGGYIWVYSEVGRGACFKVYLPRVEEAVATDAASAPPEPSPRGHETVLVAEDSESLRELIRELLTEQGYNVLTVSQGEEALALIQEGTQPVDLLLTDVVMPRLGGKDLTERLMATHPGLRVVYMSGYSGGAISSQGVLDGGAILLEKPFTGEKLARTIRLALGWRPVDGSGSVTS